MKEIEPRNSSLGQCFGLGLAVRTETGGNALHGSLGDYFWAGAYGTYFWIDPKEQMAVVLMMHATPAITPPIPYARLRVPGYCKVG